MITGRSGDVLSTWVSTEGEGARQSAELARIIGERVASAPRNFADWFEDIAAAQGDAQLGICKDELWTYRDLDALSNRIAGAGAAQGLTVGDTVALLLGNSLQSLAIMIGLAKLGVSFSLLDPALRGASLKHALKSIPVRMIFLQEAGCDAVRDQGLDLPTVVLDDQGRQSQRGGVLAWEDWLSKAASGEQDPSQRVGIAPDATLFYVFTSGTTGLPKAARVSHARYIASAISIAVLLGLRSIDRNYVVLPMFHIAALSALGAAISVGASVLLRERFSATRFWDDVRRYDVTTMQYLGEIARYVAALPPDPRDREHGLRAMVGAGLQPDVWRTFRDRFGVSRIIECYGSSEGVCSLINLDGVIGSVGRPQPGANALRIVRVAPDGKALARDANGNLLDCEPGEVGELVGELDAERAFEGYSSAEATSARLLTVAGTTWFRTGDLFRCDSDGYYYFMDRMGDSYRWKGENISTQEVSQALRGCRNVRNAVVYGVEVPGAEGRAGMALVEPVDTQVFDELALGRELMQQVRWSAMPLFLRVGAVGTLTNTYKVRTVELKEQGYDPHRISDRLFLLDRASRCYVPLTGEALERNQLNASGVQHG